MAGVQRGSDGRLHGQRGELERQLLSAYGRLRTDPCCNMGPIGVVHRR